jgi:hypothetical protein
MSDALDRVPNHYRANGLVERLRAALAVSFQMANARWAPAPLSGQTCALNAASASS